MDWKLRQYNNNKSHSYEVTIDYQIDKLQREKHVFSRAFNSEQIKQLYKMFSNFQTSGQSSTYVSSGSLAQKDNFLKVLSITSQIQTPWIIDSSILDDMIDVYNLFFLYFPCVENLKVKNFK